MPALHDGLILWSSCIIATVVLYGIFSGYLPTEFGTLGHDYGMFLPRLLLGYYWFQHNGLGAVPWFTPGLCGGLPFYANPQGIYYSLPQFASFFIDPLSAVRLTFFLFGALGYAGSYLLLRRVFGLGVAAALFGAVVFAFNGFFAHRLLIGHLTFHSFMLLPWAAFWLLRGPPEGPRLRPWETALNLVLAGLVFAYMFQSGNVHGIPISVLAILAVGLVKGFGGKPVWPLLPKLAGAALIAIGLSSSKLTAALSFLSAFPRTGYPLPGMESFPGLVGLVLETLFVGPPDQVALVNTQWMLDRHEFEFGLTIVPGLILIAGALQGCVWLWSRAAAAAVVRRHGWKILGLVVICLLPIAVNFYIPGWNAVLKEMPLFGNSVTLFRWFAVYIMIVVVASAIALDALLLSEKARGALAAVCIAAVIGITATTDREYYATQTYRADLIVQSHRTAQLGGTIPAITGMHIGVGGLGGPVPFSSDDVFAFGLSQIDCYESMFGYRREWFPRGDLSPGPATRVTNDSFNVKNPACYLFPEENACTPGDHFRTGDRESVEAFLDYRPFDFVRSARQRLADWLNLATLGGVGLFLAGYLGWRSSRWLRRSPPDESLPKG